MELTFFRNVQGAIGLALSVFMKEIKLETITDAQWGLEHKVKKEDELVLEEKVPRL